jgi:hypothetical protein
MVPDRAVATLALGESAKVSDDAGEKEHEEGEDGTELNYDGVHLPIGVGEVDFEEGLSEAQMSGGAHGEKFCQTFDDA